MTLHARIVDGVVAQPVGTLPEQDRRLDNRHFVERLPEAPVDVQEACGWFVVVETPSPAPVSGFVHDPGVELVGGVLTQTWTTRPATETEAAYQNKSTVETKLEADLAAMQAILDDTNANINANPAARIKDMARMLRRLGRTALKEYDGTD